MELISSADALDGFWLAPPDPETRWLTGSGSHVAQMLARITLMLDRIFRGGSP